MRDGPSYARPRPSSTARCESVCGAQIIDSYVSCFSSFFSAMHCGCCSVQSVVLFEKIYFCNEVHSGIASCTAPPLLADSVFQGDPAVLAGTLPFRYLGFGVAEQRGVL